MENSRISLRHVAFIAAAAVLGCLFSGNAGPVRGAPADPKENATGVTDKLTQYGITWKFEAPVKYGKFVTGDYWVLGPVTVIEISPAWDGTRNGSVIDPPTSLEQGYHQALNRGPKYSESLRANLPLKIEGTHSLVSTIGLKPSAKAKAVEGLDTVSVLTVVDKAPPADAFRPPYVAGEKPIFTASQLKWDRLPKLPKPAKTTLPEFDKIMQRVWLDHYAAKGNVTAALHPRSNMQASPWLDSRDVGAISLLVMLDIPERQELTYRMIQVGIDLHAISLSNNDAWSAAGDFGNGRKWPILFAGIMLGNDRMQSLPLTTDSTSPPLRSVNKFSEDGYTFYGKPAAGFPAGKPLFGVELPQKLAERKLKVGIVDKSARDPEGLVDATAYREQSSMSWVGVALAARLMGAEKAWGHPPFFDYVDRWVKEGGGPEEGVERKGAQAVVYTYGSEFVKVMWEQYRSKVNDFAKASAN